MRVIAAPNLEHVLRDMLRRVRLRDHAAAPERSQSPWRGPCSTDGDDSGDRANDSALLTPLQLAERRLDAYNARDLDRFLANFSNDVELYRMPVPEPALAGKRELREFYASRCFNMPALHAELVSRAVLGNKVFDRERIWGVGTQPIERFAVFEVHEGLIRTVWDFSPG
jgi:hypothetical protein